jgi:hypothetical protein
VRKVVETPCGQQLVDLDRPEGDDGKAVPRDKAEGHGPAPPHDALDGIVPARGLLGEGEIAVPRMVVPVALAISLPS